MTEAASLLLGREVLGMAAWFLRTKGVHVPSQLKSLKKQLVPSAKEGLRHGQLPAAVSAEVNATAFPPSEIHPRPTFSTSSLEKQRDGIFHSFQYFFLLFQGTFRKYLFPFLSYLLWTIFKRKVFKIILLQCQQSNDFLLTSLF